MIGPSRTIVDKINLQHLHVIGEVNNDIIICYSHIDYFIVATAFRVFNRLGNLVYETSDPDFKWNGQDKKGSYSPEGVYVYQVKALDFDGILIEKQGTITLVR